MEDIWKLIGRERAPQKGVKGEPKQG